MGKGDTGRDRAERLLEQIRPVLLKILQNAPSYGAFAFEVTIHDGNATFVEEKRRAVHRIMNKPEDMGRECAPENARHSAEVRGKEE